MKKTLIIGLTAMALAAALPQSAGAAVGIKGGVAWTNFNLTSATPPPTFLDRKEYTAGLYANLGFGFISIEPEALYVRMGAKTVSGSDTLALQIDYIQVPLLLKVNILPAGPIKPCVFAGPYGSVLLSARRVSDIGGTHSDESIKSETRSTDYGLVFGAGIDVNLAVIKLSIDGRYCLGLANIDTTTTGTDTLKNKAIMIIAGVGF